MDIVIDEDAVEEFKKIMGWNETEYRKNVITNDKIRKIICTDRLT